MTSREGVAESIQALAAEEVSEQAQRTTTELWLALQDRDRALGDLFAVVDHLLTETGYRFAPSDRRWFSEITAKAMHLAGREIGAGGSSGEFVEEKENDD